jgi:hypothetical protein
MILETTLTERFLALIKDTEAPILPYLQTVDPTIQQLHGLCGHPLPIVNTLMGMNNPQSYQYLKYPLIAVFEDIVERGVVGDVRSITPRIVIVNQTTAEYTRKERDDKNFKPILIPIYNEFMRQLRRNRYFRWDYKKPGDKTMRPFWGKEGLYGSEGNIAGDALDCIELRIELIPHRAPTCAPAFKRNF